VTLAGKLLVALPLLSDHNFDRTVVLLLNHDDDGALGVVLNRPSTTDVADVLPRWDGMVADPAVVHVGGPCQQEVAIALGYGNDLELVTIDLDSDPLLSAVRRIRVFAGYAGWSPGQLEVEIREGAWVVVDSLPLDAFTETPQDLRELVLRRQPGKLRWMANLPEDVSVN
jgi:putative transcriptional regulator